MPDTNQPLSARERILATAGRLFYAQGYHAVGIDTIVAESGVAKMTLYRHFPSKDDLIVAYLERANQQFWSWLTSAVVDASTPRAKLVAAFEAVGKLAGSPQCLGCTFQGAAAEFPAAEHRAHQVALAHKQAVREWFHDLAQQAGLREPTALATQLLLLMDGAWVAARMFGTDNPAKLAVQAAEALIEAHS
jgi:AcrR family transcriptional regulator